MNIFNLAIVGSAIIVYIGGAIGFMYAVGKLLLATLNLIGAVI